MTHYCWSTDSSITMESCKTVKQSVEMHLKADHFDARMQAWLDVKNGFDLKLGRYMLRIATRDFHGKMIAALNTAVEIPQSNSEIIVLPYPWLTLQGSPAEP